jgi:hypothetical protein
MTDTPMTVGELMQYLSQIDPASVVMLDCEDDYYSAPLKPDALRKGHAVLVSPFDWAEEKDEYGKPLFKPRVHHYPGGWQLQCDDSAEQREFTERRACLIIRV